MRVLVTGASGQLGFELVRAAWPVGTALVPRSRADLDVASAEAVRAVLDRERPDLVVNAAAYTAVDRAESEPELAFAVNRDGPAHLAEACERVGAALIHVSTDYVFDGSKIGAYVEDDPVAPLGVYGASKEAGERAVRERLERHVILRTSWVFGARAHNFVGTIARLAEERDVLRVVADQHGRPTPAADLAAAIVVVATAPRWGTYHYAGDGVTTWFGLAKAVVEATGRRPDVVPIATSEYPTPARRPANSVLDTTRFAATFGLRPPPWSQGLARVMAELEEGRSRG